MEILDLEFGLKGGTENGDAGANVKEGRAGDAATLKSKYLEFL